MVKLVVSETGVQILGLEKRAIIDALSETMSFEVPGARFMQSFKMGRWDGRERLLEKTLKFPSGLLGRACGILTSFGESFEIEETMKYPSGAVIVPALNNISLRPYQTEVIDAALARKSGTIQIATGGGKSIIIAYLAAALDVQTMIYVVSLDLLMQLKDTLESILGHRVGVVGGGACDIQKITVCSVWTAGLACGERLSQSADDEDLQRDHWEPSTRERGEIVAAVKTAKAVMLDESQFAAANSIRMILKNSIMALYKYGFSATPWRSSGDDILLEAAFGEKICSINATSLIEGGYLVPPKIFFRDIPKPEGKMVKKWQTVKSNYIVNNEDRNNLLLGNIRKLLKIGRKPLALFREIKHGKQLYEALKADTRVVMVDGMLNLREREHIRKQFTEGFIDVIVASTVYDQGIDLPALDALVLCAGGKSTAKALQRVGRVIRTFVEGSKKDAIVVETFDQTHFVREHSLSRYGIYKTEPAFAIKVEPQMDALLKRRSGDWQ